MIRMPALENLDFIERAMLLHQLFPSEIPALLQYVEDISRSVARDMKASEWDHGNIPFTMWISLAQNTSDNIVSYKGILEKDSSAFALQLFDGYKAIFAAHCIRLYADTEQRLHKKFTMMVQVLFGHEA